MGYPYEKYVCKKNAWAELRGPNTRMPNVSFEWLKPNLSKQSFREKKERLRIRHKNKKTENHEKQRLATLKRLKRGDENELERKLRLEKMVAAAQLILALIKGVVDVYVVSLKPIKKIMQLCL